MTCRCTVTTTVFCILLLVTMPTFCCRRPAIPSYPEPRGALRRGSSRRPFQLLLAQQGFHPRQVLAQPPDLGQGIRLAPGKLELELEELARELALLGLHLFDRPLAHLFSFHASFPPRSLRRRSRAAHEARRQGQLVAGQ